MTRRYKICISGGSKGESAERAYPLAREVGKEVAKRGHVLITGATTGVPHEAAKAAKKAGGSVIGFSPAGSEAEHKKKYHLPMNPEIYDHVIFAEFGYTGRNLLMVRSADATIVIDGRIGTLNEFTSAFEEHEIVGVLEGSGGIADEIRRILSLAQKGKRKVIFGNEPKKLVRQVIQKISQERRKK